MASILGTIRVGTEFLLLDLHVGFDQPRRRRLTGDRPGVTKADETLRIHYPRIWFSVKIGSQG